MTGSNTGIGKRIASNLCQHGATVIIACRSQSRASRAMDDIRVELLEAHRRGSPYATEGKLEFIELDLSSLLSVKAFSKRFYERYSHLDVLVNNGGINTAGTGADGMQQLFTTNYLGHFYLFQLMEQALSAPSPASRHGHTSGRVVNLSSVTHHTGHPDFETSCFSRHGKATTGISILKRLWGATLNRPSYYSDSKLYLNLLTLEINRRCAPPHTSIPASDKHTDTTATRPHRPITAVSVNPGAVRSDIWRSVPSAVAGLYDIFMRLFYLTVEQGAAPALYGATVTDKELALHNTSPSCCRIGRKGAGGHDGERTTYGQDRHSGHGGGRMTWHPYVPYIVPYHTTPPLLAWEMIGPFAGPQWAAPSLPTDPVGVAERLWMFSESVVQQQLQTAAISCGDSGSS